MKCKFVLVVKRISIHAGRSTLSLIKLLKLLFSFYFCRGDSGGKLRNNLTSRNSFDERFFAGPMMKLVTTDLTPYWILVGIVSYGPIPCGQENRPAIYTKVDSHVDWIENKIKL